MKITDEKIFKIAFITTIIGIIGLVIFTPFIEVKEVEIKEISRSMIDEEVAITGVVQDIKLSSSGKIYFLTINDGTGKLPVIIFESTMQEIEDSKIDINLFKNRKVKVIGTITEYKSKMELILSNSNSIKII